ncbi:MAG: SDR family oxidoreductase [Sphingopyxis sp.]|nr:SDR family oxidoreductase [Sphingopyxis sp.]
MRVIVTGAAGSLGEAVVHCFAQAGERVACVDRLEGGKGDGRRWFPVEDLSKPDAAERAIGEAAAWLGGIDALIHLVGAFEWIPVIEAPLEVWRRLYRANVETAVSAVRAAVPHCARGASIVTIGAASAQPAPAGMAPYASSKAGVARLSEALAEELRPMAIRVNTLLPSIIDTTRNRADMPDADFTTWVRPDAIADAIYFLASPAARAVNGASLSVTNGSDT